MSGVGAGRSVPLSPPMFQHARASPFSGPGATQAALRSGNVPAAGKVRAQEWDSRTAN
jgi:hypothetical protein